jgi:hypothetical protein
MVLKIPGVFALEPAGVLSLRVIDDTRAMLQMAAVISADSSGGGDGTANGVPPLSHHLIITMDQILSAS